MLRRLASAIAQRIGDVQQTICSKVTCRHYTTRLLQQPDGEANVGLLRRRRCLPNYGRGEDEQRPQDVFLAVRAQEAIASILVSACNIKGKAEGVDESNHSCMESKVIVQQHRPGTPVRRDLSCRPFRPTLATQ